jgi:hypothetical protein
MSPMGQRMRDKEDPSALEIEGEQTRKLGKFLGHYDPKMDARRIAMAFVSSASFAGAGSGVWSLCAFLVSSGRLPREDVLVASILLISGLAFGVGLFAILRHETQNSFSLYEKGITGQRKSEKETCLFSEIEDVRMFKVSGAKAFFDRGFPAGVHALAYRKNAGRKWFFIYHDKELIRHFREKHARLRGGALFAELRAGRKARFVFIDALLSLGGFSLFSSVKESKFHFLYVTEECIEDAMNIFPIRLNPGDVIQKSWTKGVFLSKIPAKIYRCII